MTGVEGVRSPDVCRVVGVTYRQLDYWARTDLVRPTVEANGQGSQRLWSVDDIVRLALVKRLCDAGISLVRVRRLMIDLRSDVLDGGAVVVLTPAGASVVPAERLAEMLAVSGVVHAVHVGSVRGQVERGLAELDARRRGLEGVAS